MSPLFEKQKCFIMFIVAGAFIIFLQQCSLLTNNYHMTNSSLFKQKPVISRFNKSTSECNKQSILLFILLFSIDTDSYDSEYFKFLNQLSKSISKRNKKAKLKSLSSSYNPLKHFAVYNGTNQTKVLIVAYFRSGSSFLGDLLQQNWKTFYTFEPFHYMTRHSRIDGANITTAYSMINSLYDCDFSQNSFYVKWINKNKHLIRWNKFLWSICKFRSDTCYSDTSLRDVCQRSRYNVIKVVRLRMKHLEALWNQISSKNVKIVYLVRDPRGIYNSRKRMDWCIKANDCSTIDSICSQMREDLIYYDRLKKIIGDRLIMLRYEDLTLDPVNQTKSLFANLSLDYSSSVSRFLHTHTKSNSMSSQNHNPYSTYRTDSNSTAYFWMKDLNASEILLAGKVCNDVLQQLNYKSL